MEFLAGNRIRGTLSEIPNGKITAMGGTPTINGTKTVHKFTTTGASTFNVSGIGEVEYLVVAGGGSGGNVYSGGGGAGGFRTATNFRLTPQNYTITVGAGATTAHANGSNSVFSSIISTGGGGDTNGSGGANGGSGGGSSHGLSAGISSPVTSPVQGYAGGSGYMPYTDPKLTGGGGGGAGGTPATAPSSSIAGAGGVGRSSTILDGSTDWYAGGGGGGAIRAGATMGAGGNGGGGAGSVNGSANTGGGGGGLAVNDGVWGDGGSGIVIISYETNGSTVNLADGSICYTTDTNKSYVLNSDIWTQL